MAVTKVNAKYEAENLPSSSKSKQQNEGSGTLEKILISQFEIFQKSMKSHLSSFMVRTNKVEEAFLDKMHMASRQ